MEKNETKTTPIGYLKKIDFEALRKWRLSKEDSQVYQEVFTDWISPSWSKYKWSDIGEILNNRSYLNTSFYNNWDKDRPAQLLKHLDKVQEKLTKALDYANRFNNPIQVLLTDEKFTVICFGQITDVLPTKFLELEMIKTYDDVPLAEIPKLMGLKQVPEVEPVPGKSDLVVIDGVISSTLPKKTLVEGLEQTKSEIEAEQQKLKNGLEEMRKELSRREQELRDSMEEAMNNLILKKKEFETQIFGLDHELYLLRCLLGDSVKIAHLRKGKAAPKEQSIILYQKLRFLDEDLAKVKTLYGYKCDQEEFVEDLLAKDDFILNQFCPSDKCVVLLKVSKDNSYYGSPEGNILQRFEYYNGNRIAILLKNGGNLYLAWTDQDRIYIKENFIYQGKETVTESSEDLSDIDSDEVISDGNYMEQGNRAWRQYFSRKFLLTILQGFSEYSKLIEFPEQVNFYAPSRYIIFSTADNALDDTRYGTLADFSNKRNYETEEGDYVLPVQTISGSFTEKAYWSSNYVENHERGRGYKNRVRDCQISDEVQQINLVEIEYTSFTLRQPDEEKLKKYLEEGNEEKLTEYKSETDEYRKAEALLAEAEPNFKEKHLVKVRVDNTEYSYSFDKARKGYCWRETNSRFRLSPGYIKKKVYSKNRSDRAYYISVEKPPNWNSEVSKSRSNVEIYTDEFINLTYLSSSILTYYLETKQLGSFFGQNYAYVVEYLNKGLEFIQKREAEEYIKVSSILRKDVSKIEHIDVILSDWKYQNKARDLTPRRIKKFAEYLKEVKDFEAEYKRILTNLDWIKKEKKN